MSLKVNLSERVLHFKQPAGTSRGTYTTRRSWFITLTDENGRQGIGECAPLPNLSCDDIPNYAEKLSTFCESFVSENSIGNLLPPSSILLPRTILTPHSTLHTPQDYPSMLFGLETALLNLQVGSTMLFDTPYGRGEEGIPINGLVWMGTFEEMRERIEQKLAQGFHCVKLKIGAIDFNQELELLKKIRSRYSRSEIELRVDANGAFSPDDALQKLVPSRPMMLCRNWSSCRCTIFIPSSSLFVRDSGATWLFFAGSHRYLSPSTRNSSV